MVFVNTKFKTFIIYFLVDTYLKIYIQCSRGGIFLMLDFLFKGNFVVLV